MFSIYRVHVQVFLAEYVELRSIYSNYIGLGLRNIFSAISEFRPNVDKCCNANFHFDQMQNRLKLKFCAFELIVFSIFYDSCLQILKKNYAFLVVTTVFLLFLQHSDSKLRIKGKVLCVRKYDDHRIIH